MKKHGKAKSAALILGFALAFVGCVKAPDLGTPLDSGLVVFTGEFDGGKDLLGVEHVNRANAVLISDSRGRYRSQFFKGSLLIAQVNPGEYKVTEMSYDWVSGNRRGTQTMRFSQATIRDVTGLTFKVEAGQVVLVGKVRVSYKQELLKPIEVLSVEIVDDPGAEKRALEAIATEPHYSSSPWQPQIRARLDELSTR